MLSKEKMQELKSLDYKRAFNVIDNIVQKWKKDSNCNKYGIAFILYMYYKGICNLDELFDFQMFDPELRLFMNKCTAAYWETTIASASEVSCDEVIAFILFYNDSTKLLDQDNTPDVIFDLSVRLLNISNTDNVADLCNSMGMFMNSLCCNTDNRNIYVSENRYFHRIICKIRAFILGESIQISKTDALISTFNNHFSKIFINPAYTNILNFYSNNPNYKNLLKDMALKVGNLKYSSSMQWIYILSALEHLQRDGIAVAVIRCNSLMNKSDDAFRKYLINNRYIKKVILLPDSFSKAYLDQNAILVLSYDNDRIHFVDASSVYINIGKKKTISENQILDIVEFCNTNTERSIDINVSDVEKCGYILHPSNYLQQTGNSMTTYKLKDLSELIIRGFQIKPNERNSVYANTITGYKYLSVKNITSGSLVLDHLPDMKESNKLHRYFAKKGDILISRMSVMYTVYLVEDCGGYTVIPDGGTYIIRVDNKKLNPYYLKLYLESEACHKYIKSNSTDLKYGKLIRIDTLRELPIPDISKEEQDIIANQYLQLLSEKQKILRQAADIDVKIHNLI